MSVIMFVFISMLLVILTTIIDGLIFKTLWGWFLVPLGLPTINLAMAVGIGAIISLCMPVKDTKMDKEKELEAIIDIVWNNLIKVGVCFLTGYIAHFYR